MASDRADARERLLDGLSYEDPSVQIATLNALDALGEKGKFAAPLILKLFLL